MTPEAGHLEDPGVGAQLVTWYHSGRVVDEGPVHGISRVGREVVGER